MKAHIISTISFILIALSFVYFIPAHAKSAEKKCMLVINNDTKKNLSPTKGVKPIYNPTTVLKSGHIHYFKVQCDQLLGLKNKYRSAKVSDDKKVLLINVSQTPSSYDCIHCSCYGYHHNKGNKHMDGYYCNCGC